MATANAEVKNPLTVECFSADPAPFVGGDGKVWVYASHDKDDADSFNMNDYCVFSSGDMTNWTFHGFTLPSSDIPWINKRETLWAPSGVYRDGIYYLYFPIGDSGKVGVVKGPTPMGPWTDPIGGPMDTETMDPHVFIDDDGQAYMVASISRKFRNPEPGSLRTPFIVKMKPNLIEYDGPKHIFPAGEYSNHCEASWLHKHNGKYYFSYKSQAPENQETYQNIFYCMADHPMGPYTFMGSIMKRTEGGNGGNHQGIIEYKGKWYFFYHARPVSDYRFRRNICLVELEYNEDGSIKPITEPAYDPEKIKAGKEKFGHIPTNPKY